MKNLLSRPRRKEHANLQAQMEAAHNDELNTLRNYGEESNDTFHQITNETDWEYGDARPTRRESSSDSNSGDGSNFSHDRNEESHVDYASTLMDATHAAEEHEPMILSAQETKAVQLLRLILLVVLFTSALGAALGVYFYVRDTEHGAFEARYKSDARLLFQSLQIGLTATLQAMDSFATTLVATAAAAPHQPEFPFVPLPPNVCLQAAKSLRLSRAFHLGLVSLVSDDQRNAFTAFNAQQDHWIDNCRGLMALDPQFQGSLEPHPPTVGDQLVVSDPDSSNGWRPAPVNSGPYAVTTFQYPVVYDARAPAYNFNVLGGRGGETLRPFLLEETASASAGYFVFRNVVPRDTPLVQLNADDLYWTTWLQELGQFTPETEPSAQPIFQMVYPVVNFTASGAAEIPVDVFSDVTAAASTTNAGAAASSNQGQVVGLVAESFLIKSLLGNILPDRSRGFLVVFDNPCGQVFTYQVDGATPLYLGNEDFHESAFNPLEIAATLEELLETSTVVNSEDTTTDKSNNNKKPGTIYSGFGVRDLGCPMRIRTYPSRSYENKSKDPLVFAVMTGVIFVFSGLLFLIYDSLVEQRQDKILRTATKSTAIVSALFPATVRDRLFEQVKVDDEESGQKHQLQHNSNNNNNDVNHRSSNNNNNNNNNLHWPMKRRASNESRTPHWPMKRRASNESRAPVLRTMGSFHSASPANVVADLYPEATVMFMDIKGFTAWSSVREPINVFTLLETIYGAFDTIAHKLGVFKVETIGDSYLAVAGLPTVSKDHAVVMARFAWHCLHKMDHLLVGLEELLGPGTGDLMARFGMHSGPVTAGVLRGERARFQLFGDTVNTASRMESTSEGGKIQCSQMTRDFLIAAGKDTWLTKRETMIEAKGKGMMQTYWVAPHGERRASASNAPTNTYHLQQHQHQHSPTSDLQSMGQNFSSIRNRDLGLMKDRLVRYNVEILTKVLKRLMSRRIPQEQAANVLNEAASPESAFLTNPLDEVKEVIDFSVTDGDLIHDGGGRSGTQEQQLDQDILNELTDFVRIVSAMYKDEREYHNFEHASHVVVSLSRLLNNSDIKCDPMVEFACIFAALIHDLDHPGVSNKRMIDENSGLATLYKNRSVLEQNSVDLAWQLWLDSSHSELRAFVCPTEAHSKLFRQVVVNLVLATDIADEMQTNSRRRRWKAAFNSNQEQQPLNNERRTLILEHMLQAADLGHLMQHWNVFRKWNKRLFAELSTAYRNGRAKEDPASFWYEGEIKFFDKVVIPLTRRLEESGVCGGAATQCRTYAETNRNEWAQEGQALMEDM